MTAACANEAIDALREISEPQLGNKRRVKQVFWNGRNWFVPELARHRNISAAVLSRRLYSGMQVARAIEKPIISREASRAQNACKQWIRDGDIVLIPLQTEQFARIDAADAERVAALSEVWRLHHDGRVWATIYSPFRRLISLSRVIAEYAGHGQIEHLNKDLLDCRASNLIGKDPSKRRRLTSSTPKHQERSRSCRNPNIMITNAPDASFHSAPESATATVAATPCVGELEWDVRHCSESVATDVPAQHSAPASEHTVNATVGDAMIANTTPSSVDARIDVAGGRRLTFEGETRTLREFGDFLSLTPALIAKRLDAGWFPVNALVYPASTPDDYDIAPHCKHRIFGALRPSEPLSWSHLIPPRTESESANDDVIQPA